MKAPDPRRYPRHELLGAAFVIAVLTGAEVDVILGDLAHTALGWSVAQDATLGLLPCSGDYASGNRG